MPRDSGGQFDIHPRVRGDSRVTTWPRILMLNGAVAGGAGVGREVAGDDERVRLTRPLADSRGADVDGVLAAGRCVDLDGFDGVAPIRLAGMQRLVAVHQRAG